MPQKQFVSPGRPSHDRHGERDVGSNQIEGIWEVI